jgi:MSHA biogenesis protein MshP
MSSPISAFIQYRASMRLQRGMSLVTAIFLVVVLAGLAGAMARIFIGQQTSSALDIQGVRAYQAARAGIEWGVYQQMRNDSCNASWVSYPLPAGSTLSGFTFTVKCVYTRDVGPALATQDTAASISTAGSRAVTGVNTSSLVQGMVVQGPGIYPGTTIASIDSATTLTLSNAASGSGTTLKYYSPLDRWQITAYGCNNSSGCPITTTSADYVSRRLQVSF